MECMYRLQAACDHKCQVFLHQCFSYNKTSPQETYFVFFSILLYMLIKIGNVTKIAIFIAQNANYTQNEYTNFYSLAHIRIYMWNLYLLVCCADVRHVVVVRTMMTTATSSFKNMFTANENILSNS